jgi:hypothetical protein
MSTISKNMFRGAAAVSNETLYAVPSDTTAVVTNIIISNTSSVEQIFSMTLAGVAIAKDTPVSANDVIAIDLRQTLDSLDTIQGFASATSVNFHISGVEIS